MVNCDFKEQFYALVMSRVNNYLEQDGEIDELYRELSKITNNHPVVNQLLNSELERACDLQYNAYKKGFADAVCFLQNK